MAKQFLDNAGLSQLVTNIKAEDAKTLQSAKDYAESLSDQYDVVGSAATAEENAKGYTDELANGQVKDNTDAINEINKDVEALEKLVGTLPDGTQATDVVDYVNKKTEGIATDAALGELQSQLSGAQDAIDAIEADYLKKADKDELQGKIDDNAEAIETLNGDSSVDGSVDKKVADAINIFATQITDDGTINTYKEVLNYIATHGGEASEMMSAIDSLEELVGEKSVATQIAEAITAENLAQYATDEELAEAIARIVVLEGKVTAWDSAEQNAKDYADGLNTAMNTRVESLETDNTTNKSDIATMKGQISALEAGTYDDAEVRGLIKDNADAIDAIEESLAEGGATANAIADAKKAGTDAQADVDALEDVVNGVSTKANANETAISTLNTTTSTHTDKITALEEKVGDGWVAITDAEIDALFE